MKTNKWKTKRKKNLIRKIVKTRTKWWEKETKKIEW